MRKGFSKGMFLPSDAAVRGVGRAMSSRLLNELCDLGHLRFEISKLTKLGLRTVLVPILTSPLGPRPFAAPRPPVCTAACPDQLLVPQRPPALRCQRGSRRNLGGLPATSRSRSSYRDVTESLPSRTPAQLVMLGGPPGSLSFCGPISPGLQVKKPAPSPHLQQVPFESLLCQCDFFNL